jgi:hypothetical protein
VVVFSRTLKNGKEEKKERRIDYGLLKKSGSMLLNHDFSFNFFCSSWFNVVMEIGCIHK